MPAGRDNAIVSLRDENNAEVSIRGERIARASSRAEAGKSALRWSEIAIYRGDAGTYVVQEIGRSAIAGEIDRCRLHRDLSPHGVYAALTRDGTRVTLLAEEVLTRAAERDAAFARDLGDLLDFDYEDLPSPAGALQGGLQRFVVERAGARALRFFGVQLGRGSSWIPEAERWSEFALYRVADGRLLASKQQLGTTGEARKATVVLAGDAAGIVRGFSREGVGWVEGALIDAIAAGAQHDRRIASEIGAHVAAWAHEIVGSTSVRINDARYRVLERMERGAVLATEDEGTKIRVVGWNDGAETPPKQVFLALSRQRLIRRAPSPGAAGTFAWTISPKGRAVLAEARDRDRAKPRESGP